MWFLYNGLPSTFPFNPSTLNCTEPDLLCADLKYANVRHFLTGIEGVVFCCELFLREQFQNFKLTYKQSKYGSNN